MENLSYSSFYIFMSYYYLNLNTKMLNKLIAKYKIMIIKFYMKNIFFYFLIFFDSSSS